MRCDLLPACYVAPPEIRELRRLLRYRNLVVQQSVRMQNKIAGLLMECGATYNKARLHGSKYFQALLGQIEEVPDSVKEMLRLSRGALDMFQSVQRQLLKRLHEDAGLHARVERLCSIGGIGEVTALTWALEIADPHRFGSVSQAVSYCGLTAALPLLGRQTATRSDLKAAQRASADGADRGGEAGAALESGTGGGSRARTRARTPQPGHAGGGAQAGGLLIGGGQIRICCSRFGRRRRKRRKAANTALSSPAGMVVFPTPPPVVAQAAERSSRSRVRSAAPKTPARP